MSQHRIAGDNFAVVDPATYQRAIAWIGRHFAFGPSQQIDWSGDPTHIEGSIEDFIEGELATKLVPFNVDPTSQVYVVWVYGGFGVVAHLAFVARHIDDVWLPATDDVFVFDPDDTWCLELHHEGKFSCGRYVQM